ncbi:MAG TPA: hypothetical protein VK193_00965 [Methyloceanibacter sp.]|jgi:hypothetical protein|nr:hypothetical protein [Methyloceanibacter sp.]
MNVIDRSFAAEADRLAKAERARRKHRRRLAIVASVAVAIAAIAYYVWATTLCGDCGAPVPLPPA